MCSVCVCVCACVSLCVTVRVFCTCWLISIGAIALRLFASIPAMMLLVVSCFCLSANALRFGASSAISAPDAEEAVRAKLVEAQRKFAEASGATTASAVSFVAGGAGANLESDVGIPVVDVGLSQGAGAWPGITQAIGAIESARQKMEDEHEYADMRLFNAGLAAAEGRIEKAAQHLVSSSRAAGSPLSFVEVGAGVALHSVPGSENVAVRPWVEPQIIEVDVPAAVHLNEQAVGDALRGVEQNVETAEAGLFREGRLSIHSLPSAAAVMGQVPIALLHAYTKFIHQA